MRSNKFIKFARIARATGKSLRASPAVYESRWVQAMSKLFLLVAIAFALLSTSSRSLACSCVAQPGSLSSQVAAALKQADAVFTAEVIEVEDFNMGNGDYQKTHLRVIEAWKGPNAPGSTVRTITKTECCLCGRRLKQKQLLLLYLSGEEPYTVSECSRTQSLEDAKDDVAVLTKLQSQRATPLLPRTPNKPLQPTAPKNGAAAER